MTVSVAIVGSGPAGFYTARALLDRGDDYAIDIIDLQPSPYGLIRFGVAPDHQTTKNVMKKFIETALQDQVCFFGNVEVGRDVSVDELRDAYDAVVLAIGASDERGLTIPGGDLPGVYPSQAFAGWYNAQPQYRDLDPLLDGDAIAVIGNGNVAIDVARVLVKSESEMASSDLPRHVASAIRSSPLCDVYVFGRRGPNQAKFTNVELREMGGLEHCVSLVDPAQLPDEASGLDERDLRLKKKNLETLRGFTGNRGESKPKRVHFHFYAMPIEVLGESRVEGLRLERTRLVDARAQGTGETFEIACGAVIAAIGYRARPIEGIPFDVARGVVPNAQGRVADGLYAAGWIMRGPSGVISTNKKDGAMVAGHIEAEIDGGGKPGRPGLEGLLRDRGVRVVSFADWQAIETAEIAGAAPPAPRRKFTTADEMLAVLDQGTST